MGLLAGVDQPVLLQVSQLCEALLADGALERSFPAVHTQVDLLGPGGRADTDGHREEREGQRGKTLERRATELWSQEGPPGHPNTLSRVTAPHLFSPENPPPQQGSGWHVAMWVEGVRRRSRILLN